MSPRLLSIALLVCFLALAAPRRIHAQASEPPYFVTYSSVMEEPDNLEIDYRGTQGTPPNANGFYASTVEFEYGMRAWWTTEVYLSGVTVANDSTVFTGFRFENRFHVLPRQHFLNPVLYVEYEDHNDDDRGVLEVTGHDGNSSLNLTNAQGRLAIERELELKLILDSNFKGWNVAENFISEKNFNEPEPWEFGYAVGASHPLKLAASRHKCVFCRENFSAGVELYGGLSTLDDFGLRGTSQYLGPTVQWNIPHGPSIQFSPNIGLNDNSVPVLYRFSVSYEIQQFANRLFHRQS
jgi:hypothetical protein